MGIASISLAASATKQSVKPRQNLLVATGSFTLADGTVRSLGDAALAFKPSGAGGGATPVGSSGGDLDNALARLTAALRTGLDQSPGGLRNLTLPAASDLDPFDFSAEPQLPSLLHKAGRHTQDMPREALSAEALPAAYAAVPAPADRRLALMAQESQPLAGWARRPGGSRPAWTSIASIISLESAEFCLVFRNLARHSRTSDLPGAAAAEARGAGEDFVDDQQQIQSAFPSTSSQIVSRTLPPLPPTVSVWSPAAQLALTGGNLDDLVIRLISSLRAGLPGSSQGDSGVILQLPRADESLDSFTGRNLDDSAADPAGQIAAEAATIERPDAGAPDTADRIAALMVQDMAAFGGVGLDETRLTRPVQDHRFDYFA
ncbi:MAG: hypothetical protein ABIR60_03200 [Allosphingosinicella sp.]